MNRTTLVSPGSPLAVALVMVAAPLCLLAEVTEWQIDSSHSSAQFAVRHMMVTTVRGQFGGMKGTARFDPADPSTAQIEVTVDANSVDTRHAKRDAHLRSADFFEVEKFPQLTFRSKRAEAAGSGQLRLIGDLTIRGVTREVTFDVEGPTPPVKDQRGNLRVGATATAKIDRKDFGLTWNRALDTGGVVVGNEVQITMDAALVQQGSAQR